ncbi:MAG: hypothetical protein O3B86_14170, partial [Planctomycetota bacterium]|nr:hypothetical protein [Planctomycetota bacterium]
MRNSQVVTRSRRKITLATWGAVAFGGAGSLSLMATAADEPAEQSESRAIAVAVGSSEVGSIDGAEIFAREWIPGDKRSHGGDGLGPVFNDSSCVACHNQGGIGGGGPASKNVDIVTAFHTPHQRQVQRSNTIQLPATLPGILFQSVFGNLDSIPPLSAGTNDDSVATASEDAAATPLNAAEKAAELQKSQELRRKREVETDRNQLAMLHPGFAFANSVVLHKDATFAGYQTWRGQMAGMQFGIQHQQADVQLFGPEVSRAADEDAVGRGNGHILMAQLKQQVQTAAMRGMNSSSRQGNFVITKSQRNTTALFGAGLIDSIPTAVLESLESAQTKNRVVSGRVARLKDGSAGRFGWKSQKARLSDFVMTACAVEVGLNVPDHPQAGHPQNADYRP